jgi:hypothetical protein
MTPYLFGFLSKSFHKTVQKLLRLLFLLWYIIVDGFTPEE